MEQRTPVVVVVDWGTSQLRIWPLAASGEVLDCHKSDEGMRVIDKNSFESVLEKHLAKLGIDRSVPVIMCGMVGSRQGWHEAPYVKMPCRIEDIITKSVRVPDIKRDVRILPGVASYSAETPDVMRSEETQLLGLYDLLGDELGGHICMPGSHVKWVRFEKGVLIDFATGLTGELFAALGVSSVLKYAIEASSNKINSLNPEFTKSVRQSLAEPATILTRLFSARPQCLLHGMSNDDATAYISGTILGQDIAGAKVRFSPMHSVALVGSGHLGKLYQSALNVAGLKSKIYDGDELAIAGLSHAAKSIWPERFIINPKAKRTD